ncbi:DNA-binding protein [Psychrobacillus sp. FSL H8-0487]|uniref:DNA-binding protein n=1 Tax=Psychrobacillus sp. FSL H8-0487 TaxID=2921391 RepID=UPI0030FA27F3
MVEKMIIGEKLFTKKQELLNELTDVVNHFVDEAFEILDFDKEKYDYLKNRQEEIKKEIREINEQYETIDSVMGVEEASESWILSAGYIKNLCADGKVKAKKIGKTWIIDRHQPHPSRSSE